MANRIRNVTFVNHRLDPHETELRILVELDEITPTTEIKGRLMGPRSAYASTVEVAYPIREIERGKAMAVVIPEPSWWSPKTPFLYQGPLELWQDGHLCERTQISHGIRSLRLTARELRVNGLPLVLRGTHVEPTCSEAELRDVRSQGFNAVITALAESAGLELWNQADRVGVFVIGYSERSAEEFLRWKNELEKHPSALAWAFSHAGLIPEAPSGMWYGVSSAEPVFANGVSFVLCHEGDPIADQETPIAKIMVTRSRVDSMPPRPNVIGWIADPPLDCRGDADAL